MDALVGCTTEFFINYIKSLFTIGMTMENYGKYGWHIDHIIGCNKYNLHDEKQRLECYHYTNLRPLWATTEIAQQYGEIKYIGNLNRRRFCKWKIGEKVPTSRKIMRL